MNKVLRPLSNTLGDLLDELAALHPEREAIVFENHRISYKSLRDKTNILACSLIALGVKPGDRVALLAPNKHQCLTSSLSKNSLSVSVLFFLFT